MDICRRICNIPHGSLCDNCNIAVFFPRTRERNSKKIFLATDDRCNYRRRPGGWINHPVLTCHPAPPLVIASAAKQSSQLTCRNTTPALSVILGRGDLALSLSSWGARGPHKNECFCGVHFDPRIQVICITSYFLNIVSQRDTYRIHWIATVALPPHTRMTRNKNAGKGPRNSFSLLHCNNVCTLY